MDFDIKEIIKYYGEDVWQYKLNDLLNVGISRENANFISSSGLPKVFSDFIFFEFEKFEKITFKNTNIIKIGQFSFGEHGLFLKENEDELFASSSYHEPEIYIMNKNIETFFLFHLIKNKIAINMIERNKFNSFDYALELKKVYNENDYVAMEDQEGYWSHLVEDYETGL
ncbi:hypothetical protein LBW89_18390 [Paenibacillus sp. alder61]|uniref:SUKH-4 immunity protein n=1 Tax=Paenibacillus faecis TaxID=862114 RepID=A0A5D0CMG9_9BACL|nr:MULTISPECIES: hypothetical protein [Paenibacillus]MCA1294985.1 hypothetical protein [Paenibacillus sp. alder61]TYA10750.1 hypothetical protein FRY98_23495 [Paenibacillus faecis]